MENVKNFLESSTIHGLAYIPTGRKYAKLSWIIVVIAGFTGAGYLIYQSFDDWHDNPVKTMLETLKNNNMYNIMPNSILTFQYRMQRLI